MFASRYTYEDEADLVWQRDWLQGEVMEVVEGEEGAIEVEMKEEGSDRQR